jgi:ferric enterobactin receptor
MKFFLSAFRMTAGSFVWLMAFASPGLCQSTGSISGRSVDSVTHMALNLATVSLFKEGSMNAIHRVSTDEKGGFTINHLPEGRYRLTIEFLGYQAKTISNVVISSKMAAVIPGIVQLVPVAQQLSTATVYGSAPVVQNKMDKLIYNPENDISSQGGVALDILRKVPMVEVDIDGNVELQGDANVRFLINGKPSAIFGANLSDALQTIPASQIKSIEVMTNPGAKYDAEGTAGIINIVLKDSKIRGINGSVNLSAGTRLENTSVNLHARNGHLGFNAFFSGNDQVNSTTLTTTNRISYSNTGDTVGHLYQNGKNPFVRKGYQSGFSVDWQMAPKDELTATVDYDDAGNNGTGVIAQQEQSVLSSGPVLSDILSTRRTVIRSNERSVDMSLAYKKTFSKDGQEFDFLYSTTYGQNNIAASQLTDYSDNTYPLNGLQSVNPGTDHETDISVDYSQPLVKGYALETGAKAVLENIHTDAATDTLLSGGNNGENNGGKYGEDASQSYHFSFGRNIYAAYVSVAFHLFGDFLHGKAGLRYEGTHSIAGFGGITIPDNQLWAPSVLAEHTLSESESVKFAYTYRVERPDYDDLNPFVNVSDPNNISSGNPLLKNELNHKFELGYSKSFKSGANFNIGGFYNYATNDAQMVTFFYPVYTVNAVSYDNVSLTEPFNVAKQVTYGSTVSGSVPITSQFNVRSNVLLKEFVNYMPGSPVEAAFSYKVSMNASYQLADNMMAEAFGSYSSRREGYDHIRPAFFFYTFAVRKQLLHKKLSFGLTTTNPFSPYVHQLTTQFGPNFNQNNLRLVPLRSFGISASITFGKLKVEKDDKKEENIPPLPLE